MKKIILITGGCRSGKSSYALAQIAKYDKKVFIATAEALDAEMEDRITKHRKERGKSFQTIEEPLNIADAIKNASTNYDAIILDCLTVWMGNLQYRIRDKSDRETYIKEFLDGLINSPRTIILVTNEIGMGVVPDNELSRQFRDAAGWLNQKVAELADQVVLMVSGIPMIIKGKES